MKHVLYMRKSPSFHSWHLLVQIPGELLQPLYAKGGNPAPIQMLLASQVPPVPGSLAKGQGWWETVQQCREGRQFPAAGVDNTNLITPIRPHARLA